jgi:hypothetical protein
MADNDGGLSTVSVESISASIVVLRGRNVMLSHHLASLYGVETKVSMQAVKRNLQRFASEAR